VSEKNIKKTSIIRLVILGIILIGSMLVHYLHSIGGVKYPSVHAICPYGGIENLWAWFSGRANIQKIFSGTMTLFFLTVIFAIVFSRSFCGNICPFGALQELIGLIVPKKIKVPQKADRYLRKIKYLVLIISIIMAWVTMTLWLSPFDPWAAFSHIYKGQEMINEFAIGTIVLVITVIASLFISRFFCKYLCPAGALYALISKISPMKIVRDTKKCVNCGICTKNCPMDIEVHEAEKVKSSECITCSMCVDVCPGAGTMIAVKAGRFSLKPLLVVILSVTVFFGSIFILDALGLYTVSLPTQEEIQEKGDYIGIQDLRGSMSIEQGAFYTGKGLDEFYDIMEIPKTVSQETLLKNIQFEVPGYDFHSIKASKGDN
jgi:ferredoxin